MIFETAYFDSNIFNVPSLSTKNNPILFIRTNISTPYTYMAYKAVNKGDEDVIDGRLQNAVATAEDGSEKKIVEIDASSVMKISGGITQPIQNVNVSSKANANEPVDELIGEDEIPF